MTVPHHEHYLQETNYIVNIINCFPDYPRYISDLKIVLLNYFNRTIERTSTATNTCIQFILYISSFFSFEISD